MKTFWDLTLVVLVFGFVGGFLLFLASIPVSVVIGATTHSSCLAYGYPDHHVDWSYTRYCHRREGMTDVVVRLTDLRRAHR